MVGTQAVMNVMTGERYKMVPKEINEYVRGLYGKTPAPVDPEVLKKILNGGTAKVITHRPADDLAPQFEELKEKYKDLVRSDEDVLTCALFENVAVKFLQNKYKPKEEAVEINLYIG
jgi:oxaloacetate decarboxylase alpha subunit